MPAAAATRATLPTRASSSVRTLLLLALAAGLAGLSLPGGAAPVTSAAAAAPSPLAAAVVGPAARPAAALLAETVPLAVRAPAPAPHVAAPRATRSRRLALLWVRPVAAPITSPYGMRWGRLHPGVDFGAPYGAPIHAVGPGVVLGAGYLPGEDGYGLIVLVQHPGGVVTAYAHASQVLVHAGQRVEAGTVIALVGATGDATGPHLHFEVRIGGVKVDPVPWLRAHGVDV